MKVLIAATGVVAKRCEKNMISEASVNEANPVNPGSSYQEAKVAGEALVLAAQREHQFPVVIARFPAVFGAVKGTGGLYFIAAASGFPLGGVLWNELSCISIVRGHAAACQGL